MVAPWNPVLVTSTMPPMPAEAEAPPDLATPATPSAAASACCARCSSTSTDGMSGSSRSRSGNAWASSAGSARPANLSSGAARAMATARSASASSHRSADRWSRSPPACGRPARANRHRRLRSAAIPRPRRHAHRPTARSNARQRHRPCRRRRGARRRRGGRRDRRGRIDRAVRTFAVCNWFMGRQQPRQGEKTGRMTKPRCACAARVSTRRTREFAERRQPLVNHALQWARGYEALTSLLKRI